VGIILPMNNTNDTNGWGAVIAKADEIDRLASR
jgi:hypothetical protein